MHPQDSILPPWVVLHLPHVSTVVPPGVRDQFLLGDDALAAEMDRLTDHCALELFLDDDCFSPNIRATVSRVVVDMERFVDDAQEPAARHGFGAIYTKTTTGEQLRRHLNPGECEALLRRHADHHARLAVAVDAVRRQHGRCLVLDCHTFPDLPLPFEVEGAGTNRPDICIGTDAHHTPPELARAFVTAFERAGWSVSVDWPFAGALVPTAFYGTDAGILAIMVEVNRRICDGECGPVKGPDHPVARLVRECCAAAIGSYMEQAGVVTVDVGERHPRVSSPIRTFEVDGSATIKDAEHYEPTTRAEFFETEVDGWSKSPSALAEIVDCFEPMAWAVHDLYEEARSGVEEEVYDLERDLDDGEFVAECDLDALRKRIAARRAVLENMPSEPYEGASSWVSDLDADTFREKVVPQIEAWLAGAPGMAEVDYIPDNATGRGAAFEFFRDMDSDSLRQLGVKVIEGEYPGSSYYAAELRRGIGVANTAALENGIPIRFVSRETVLGPCIPREGAKSAISAKKVSAYTETEYRVACSPPIVLRVGDTSSGLTELHAQWGVESSVFVTAYNPKGKSLDDAANVKRQEGLREELRGRRLRRIDGVGMHPSNGWPAESSFLVLGIGLDEARELGARWGQDAVVWCGMDAVPRLVLLR